MNQEELRIKRDRMRYTKDKFSANLTLVAILFDALYFVNIYQSDVGTYYYNWVIGVSVVYNLLFMLMAFLASEGVKNRASGYTPLLIFIGLVQFARIFYLPTKAHAAFLDVQGVSVQVMSNSQYGYLIVCLVLSGVCCLIAAVTSYINNKNLAEYMRSIENQAA